MSEVSDAIYLIRAPAKENSRMGCLTDNKSLFEGNIKTSIKLKHLFRLIYFLKKKRLDIQLHLLVTDQKATRYINWQSVFRKCFYS